MGLSSIIASAVEAARSTTESLQVQVTHEAWTGADALGDGTPYADPVSRQALVQEGAIHHKRPDGQVVTTRARIAFLQPVAPNGAPRRQEPIDPRDRLTLPSGLTGHIVDVPGVLINPETGAPYVRVVWLA